MGLVQFEGQFEIETRTVWLESANTVETGAVVYYLSNADPDAAAFDGKEVGSVVENAPTTHEPNKFAGIVLASSTGVTGPAFIDIQLPRPQDVCTVQVAVGIDAGDGGVLTDAQDFLADGGAFAAATDEFYALYDEDSANNPHGTSAISASAGLVEAVFTGINRD